ncbi:cupin domain-containing protein [Larkinella sp. GY13]|uniref:cupin domain-containing protein n=1 Tax=Larkinella sp. GY13 TaxID=3453720 RepID=UPI003EECD89D
MAHKGKEIRNPKTGQVIQFVQTQADTNGQLLELITTYEAHSKEPMAHYHPHQDEYFEVLQGALTVRLGGDLQTLQPGDKIQIRKNTVHSMWNATDDKTVVAWKTIPAMDTEYLLELNTGLASDGKTNADGVPGLLQVALMMNHFDQVFRLAKPPFAVQKIVFGLLTPFALLLGYRPFYRKYLK